MLVSPKSKRIASFVVSFTFFIVTIFIFFRHAKVSQKTELVIPTPTPQLTTKPITQAVVFPVENIQLDFIQTLELEQLQSATKSFLGKTINYQVTRINEYQLHYSYLSAQNVMVTSVAQVFIPIQESLSHIFLFGAGTTGIASQCAPSLEEISISNRGNYRNYLITQASQGVVTVMPDYHGYHQENLYHSYFVQDEEARSLLAALKSLHKYQYLLQSLPQIDFNTVVLSGYSQGGHAALAAAKAMNVLTPEFEAAGIVGFASAQDIEALLKERPQLAPYLFTAYKQYYALEENFETQLLSSNISSSLLNDISTHCIDTIYSHYPSQAERIYTKEFLLSLENATIQEDLPVLADLLKTNIPQPQINIPIVLLQGEADEIVTQKTQTQNVTKLCDSGNQVYYEVFPTNHYQIRQNSFERTQTLLKALYDRSFEQSSCSTSPVINKN